MCFGAIVPLTRTHAQPPEDAVNQVYLLKDLARLSGHSIHTLKYYLKLGLIREAGRSQTTRFRYFNQDTLSQLKRVRDLQKQGMRLADIKEQLHDEVPA